MRKEATDFIVEVSVRYSDNTNKAMEKRFTFRPEMTIDDFMNECSEAYSMMRFTCGVEAFDKLTAVDYQKIEVTEDSDK